MAMPDPEQFLSSDYRRGQLPGPAHVDGLLYEYGSRAGFWRIHNEFQQARPAADGVWRGGMALARHPEIVEAIKSSGLRRGEPRLALIHYQSMDIARSASTFTRRCTC